MSQHDIEDLLGRYLKGEATEHEKQQVELWFDTNEMPDNAWERMAAPARQEWLASVYAGIRKDIDTQEAQVIPIKRSRLLWRSIAAAAAVAAIFFAVYLNKSNQAGSVQTALVAIKTQASQKRSIYLADGSQVWVNAGSELKYPKTFSGKTREVYLSGEAYFDIEHDASKPFIIHTGNVITTVLGTAFNIKEDALHHTVVVTVTRGKVSVANGMQPLGVITPNQEISFNTAEQKALKQQVDASRTIAWQQDEIHFDDMSFADAASQLESRFNVKISFNNDKLKNCRFTGTSLKGDNLDKILKVLCAFNNASYQTKTDGSIVIDGAGCEEPTTDPK